MTPSEQQDPLPSRRALRRRRAEAEAGSPAPTAFVTTTESPSKPKSSSTAQPSRPSAPQDTTATQRRSRRAADTPVDSPSQTGLQKIVPQSTEDPAPKVSRRADAEVTRTTVRPAQDQPLTRREARRLRELAETGQHKVVTDKDPTPLDSKVAPETDSTNEDESTETGVDFSVQTSRRADSPVTSPGIIPEFSATDTGMLNSLEEERAAIAAQAAELSQRIAAAGETNPHRIDPVLLKEQQELAARAQELAARRSQEQFDEEQILALTGSTETFEPLKITPSEQAEKEKPAAPVEPKSSSADQSTPPPVSTKSTESTTSWSSLVSTDTKPSAAGTQHQEPIGASSAHGLDPLDAREWSARERAFIALSTIMFALGIITLIIGILLIIW